MKSRRCAKPTIELVQTGPSLILKFKEMAASFAMSKRGLVQFGPTQWWVWRTPYFSSSPLDFEYLALSQVYTFFQWRLYK